MGDSGTQLVVAAAGIDMFGRRDGFVVDSVENLEDLKTLGELAVPDDVLGVK